MLRCFSPLLIVIEILNVERENKSYAKGQGQIHLKLLGMI